jgi:hypothetical protein
LAVAKLHISVEDFYKMNPAEFFEAIEFANRHEQAILELYRNTAWESMRFHAMLQYNMTPGKHKAIKDPRKICQFAWEPEKEQSVETMKKVLIGVFGIPRKKRQRRTPVQ